MHLQDLSSPMNLLVKLSDNLVTFCNFPMIQKGCTVTEFLVTILTLMFRRVVCFQCALEGILIL